MRENPRTETLNPRASRGGGGGGGEGEGMGRGRGGGGGGDDQLLISSQTLRRDKLSYEAAILFISCP